MKTCIALIKKKSTQYRWLIFSCLHQQDYYNWRSQDALLPLTDSGHLLAETQPAMPKTFSTRRGPLLLYSQVSRRPTDPQSRLVPPYWNSNTLFGKIGFRNTSLLFSSDSTSMVHTFVVALACGARVPSMASLLALLNFLFSFLNRKN